MEQKTKSAQIISDLIDKHRSARAFARTINEDIADIIRWRQGKSKVGMRAVVTIVKLFKIRPHDIRPDCMPENLEFIFKGEK